MNKIHMDKALTIGLLISIVLLIGIVGGYPSDSNTETTGDYPIDSIVVTTLDRTILPVAVPSSSPTLDVYNAPNYSTYGYGVWEYGEGLPYEKRLDLLSPTNSNISGTGTARLLHFFDMTDVHISDKESPAQAMYTAPMPAGYSPVMLYTTQVFDAAIQTANALHTNKPFDFGIFLGDAANDEQYNELRWYIDVLDGKEINPDSGAKDDPIPGPLNDYQDVYKAAGLNKSIPWYQARGNHDHCWIGGLPPNDYIRANATGEYILNLNTDLTVPNGTERSGIYEGGIDGRTVNGDIFGLGNVSDFTTPPKVLAADPNRHVVSPAEWEAEFFNTSSIPKGHGFNQSEAKAGFGCYSFEPKSDIPIKVIVLDNTQSKSDPNVNGYGHATVDKERYDWLVNELDSGQAEGKLMIIGAHIPIGVQQPPGWDKALGWSSLAYVTQEQFFAKLHEYPNLILWISGHRHFNAITAQKSPDPEHPELGFWEVETSSVRDFPEQFRTFDIVRNNDNTISIFTTNVDSAIKDGSIVAKARSGAVAGFQISNETVIPYLPTGVYNAELVKPLSPEMQEKIQNYGTPIDN